MAIDQKIYCHHITAGKHKVLLVQSDAHVVGIPLLTGVAQGGVELDHLVIAIQSDLASSMLIISNIESRLHLVAIQPFGKERTR